MATSALRLYMLTICVTYICALHFEGRVRRQAHVCSLPTRASQKPNIQTPKVNCDQSGQASASSETKILFDQYWQWKLAEYPEEATWNGIHTYDDQLTNVTIEAFNERYKMVLSFLEKVYKLQPCVTDPKDTQNLDLLKYELNGFKDGHSYKGYYFAIDSLRGVDSSLPKLFDRMPLKTLEDYEKIISRLDKIPGKIDQIIQLLRAGIASGITHHMHAIKGLDKTIGMLLPADTSKSTFYKYFKKDFPASLNQQQIDQLQTKALSAVQDKVLVAFGKLKNFIVQEYTPMTRNNIAVTSLPNGVDMYKRLIWLHASGDFKPQEIHDIGLCEVKRIAQEMQKISDALGYSGKSLKEATKLIKEDPNNYHTTKEALLKGYEEIIAIVDLELPKVFRRVPSYKVIIEEDPSPSTTLAYYRSPTLDGKKPGVFVVGTNNTKSNPKYNMMTLTLHEAMPGHHHQISHAIEYSNQPTFRRAYLGVGYTASGFPWSTAYVEGWALYAEALGFQMNLFDDLLSRFGHYTWEMLRACRLVVDTGMHAAEIGWTREMAINFMDGNLALERKTIAREVDRYIAWPGQALGYKMGQLKLLGLRKKAEEKLQEAFDIKDYHEVVLNLGSVPMEYVENEVDNYIENKLKSSQSQSN